MIPKTAVEPQLHHHGLSSYQTLVNDGEDTSISDDVDIITVGFAHDNDHVFFKIVTESNVDLTDSTIAVLINDVSDTGQTNEVACSSYRTSGTSEKLHIHVD